MDLSRNIIKRYVAVSTPEKVTSNSDTRYGTVVSQGEDIFVMIDGSSILTPVTSNVSLKDDDRVLVLVKNHEATVLGSPTAPTARLEELRALEEGFSEFDIILADKVGTGELVAMQALIEDLEAKDVEISGTLQAATASIETLTAENATINGKLTAYQADIEELQAEDATITGKLTAVEADISELEAETAKIETLSADYAGFKTATADNLSAINAEIDNLDATYATVGQLDAEKARITDLEATRLTADSAEIKNLQTDVADIDTLIFGSASGTTIQTSFANAVIAQLGNAQIKSAMIDSVSADKITAGDIITNNVRVLSEDGKLLISDETIQISDDTRVRVQIGKDASNDYSVNVWDAAGKLMFSAGGITDAAIKSAIIRDDMVSETANIKASKLDISSLFSEINNSTETINSNKVLIDTDAGTLDVAFVKMESDIDAISEEVTTQGTALSVVQGQISSKVWLEDIKETDLGEVEGAISTLETQYSELNQTVSGISTTVGQHTTQIANKADSSTVTAVSDRVTEVEADLEGFRTSVSETYATKTALSATDTKAANAATAASNAQSTANEAKTNAATAQSTADTAKTNAATAQSAAEAAQSTANTAETNAATAQTAANNAATAASNAQKAADDAAEAASNAQDDVDALETRVTTAETNISQNAEAIELRATKTELTTVSNAASAAQSTADTAKTNAATAQSTADGVKTNLANNYYTKSQTDAQIKVSADAITSTVETLETTLSEDYSTTTEMNSAITQKAGEITQSVSATYATKTELNEKADDYTILLYNGTGGNPKPVKFATVNYSTCNSENGVCAKISMVSGHGNGTSYAFLQDATIRVNFSGGVEVDNVKQYGAESPTYDDAVRQYGDIFWVVDTTNKIVDFYCLMGQYSRMYQTPWRRMTYSTGGTVTQYTSATVYSSGTKVWANNSDIALMTDVTELSERVTTAESSISQNATQISQKVSSSEFSTYKTTVTSNIATAKSEAISAAATDATTKANNAQSAAISAAATDATNKANAAEEAAIEAAAEDATAKANAAKSAAATDATTKANNAKDAAISAAATDATTKANNAKDAAISAAATDATNKANAAEEAANDYTDGKIQTVTTEVNTVKSTVAQHTTSLDSVTSRVATNEQSITTINGNIDEVRSSLTNYAEISILDDKIQNVVSSNYVSQSEFGTFKGEYESQLTQTNNAISGKVSSSEFSTLKSNVDDQAKRLTDVETYFELTEDGFYVGGTKFQYVAKLTGDQLQFGLRSDDTFTPISWFATNTMYNTNVDVAEALSIGKSNSDTDGSYEFHQEADGTFSLIYKE